jgi:uracil-DNA glycosylase
MGLTQAGRHEHGRDEALRALRERVVSCRACPRLVDWREEVARSPKAALTGAPYWARPLPGFGDPAARLLVVGLAPAAHGGNRTGRMFTGDRSGDFLFDALHRAGFANQPTSTAADDGLELRDAYVTAPVRCAPPANRPTPDERARCAPFLAEELSILREIRVVLALGAFALEAIWAQRALHGLAGDPGEGGVPRRPRFAHGAEIPLGNGTRTLLCSYHPSQRNVFTGLLSAAMFDAVVERAKSLLS